MRLRNLCRLSLFSSGNSVASPAIISRTPLGPEPAPLNLHAQARPRSLCCSWPAAPAGLQFPHAIPWRRSCAVAQTTPRATEIWRRQTGSNAIGLDPVRSPCRAAVELDHENICFPHRPERLAEFIRLLLPSPQPGARRGSDRSLRSKPILHLRLQAAESPPAGHGHAFCWVFCRTRHQLPPRLYPRRHSEAVQAYHDV